MLVENMKTGLAKHANPTYGIERFEKELREVQLYLVDYLKTVFVDSNLEITYEEAVHELTLDKSPGYPYYLDCTTKEEALLKHGSLIHERTMAILAGEEVSCYFSLTEKSELRPKEKVAVGKTRVFMASDLHHLLASTMLFHKMNQAMMAHIGEHPITVGIQMPGPQYVRFMHDLASRGDGKVNDGDVDGCDLNFCLRIARMICDILKVFHKPYRARAIEWLYSCVYMGIVVGLGGMYRCYGNKSGWFRTTQDNSMMVWACLLLGFKILYPEVPLGEAFHGWINGDDVAVNALKRSFQDVCHWLHQNHILNMSADSWVARSVFNVVFLSHHLETRFVSGFGDFLVAAGNLPKLLSSVYWIKKSKTLTFQESCVAHLVGVRMCLFPWADYFYDVDQILTDYLRTVPHTPFIKACLKARFSEVEMAMLHTRRESFVFSSLCSYLMDIDKQVLKSLRSLFKSVHCHDLFSMTKTKSQLIRKLQSKTPMTKHAKNNNKATSSNPQTVVQVQAVPPAPAAVASSHAPVAPKSKGVLGMVGDVVKNLVTSEGLETLVTLGASLLASESVIAQRNEINRLRTARNGSKAILLSDTTIPQGTVLAQIPISPQFASDINFNGQQTTRLAQKANIYLKYKFKNTWVVFNPAAGALNNGQIGFFITSDPRYELVATGEEAVRLVKEFAGVVCNISQPAKLRVPVKKDWLFVSDDHESDTRFTEQGMLWILAYTDLVLASGADSGVGTTSSLGSFDLDYTIDLKDDSVDGASIAPANQQNCMVFYTEGQGTLNFTTSSATLHLGCPLASAPTAPGIGAQLVLDVNNSHPLTQNVDGTFTVNLAGAYMVQISMSLAAGTTSSGPLNLQVVNITSGITFRHPYIPWADTTLNIAAISATAYVQTDVGDVLDIRLIGDGVWGPTVPQGALISFTQLLGIPSTSSGVTAVYAARKRGLITDLRRDESYSVRSVEQSTPKESKEDPQNWIASKTRNNLRPRT